MARTMMRAACQRSRKNIGSTSPPVKRVLSQAELFARASAGFVVLERATAKGDRLDPAAAFAVGHGRLFTAVAAVDGADRISAVLPDGTRQPIVAVIAMNRQQDWMVLAGGHAGEVDQPVVSDSKIQVGDRLFSIEGPAAEAACSSMGRSRDARARRRAGRD